MTNQNVHLVKLILPINNSSFAKFRLVTYLDLSALILILHNESICSSPLVQCSVTQIFARLLTPVNSTETLFSLISSLALTLGISVVFILNLLILGFTGSFVHTRCDQKTVTVVQEWSTAQ